jgi:peroxiredoxin
MGAVSAAKSLYGRFRDKRAVTGVAPLIKVGDSIPAVDCSGGEGQRVALRSVLGAKGQALLVGMPGAFTPTCSTCHLPSLVDAAPKLKRLGVDTIAVITTNDHYVNEAWRKSIEAKIQGDVTLTMLSDADGDVVRAIGLADDLGFGMGVRSNRFALLVQDGLVRHVAVDEGMEQLQATTVDAVYSVLGYVEAIAPKGFTWGLTF